MKKEEIISLGQLVEKFEKKLKKFGRAKEKKGEKLKIELLDIHRKISLHLK